jgi:hypothetical protein
MTGLEEAKATDLEANPEEIEALVGHQKVINEEAAMETIGALEDRYGDRRLAVRAACSQRNGNTAVVCPGRSWPPPAD